MKHFGLLTKLILLIATFAISTNSYAVSYRFSATGPHNTRAVANSNGRQSAYCNNNHFYRVGQAKPANCYVFSLTGNGSAAPTFSGSGWSDFAIANDSSGNLILGLTSSGLNAASAFSRYYYSTPVGGNLNLATGDYIAMKEQNGYTFEGTQGTTTNCRAQAIRATGNVKSGTGRIYNCPSNQKFIFRI
ncbi:MAG: hypothetical protein J6Y87_01275, partial [Muribaculaceae bacterium]|nr:hypothetical protein [Muribaculaceae bacterium]